MLNLTFKQRLELTSLLQVSNASRGVDRGNPVAEFLSTPLGGYIRLYDTKGYGRSGKLNSY